MTLISGIEPKNCTREELVAVLDEIECPEILGIECSPEKIWFGLVKNKELYIGLWPHDLLTDNADWNADFWILSKWDWMLLLILSKRFQKNLEIIIHFKRFGQVTRLKFIRNWPLPNLSR